MAKAHFGMIGLGTMGRNFLLNIAEQGIAGVGYDLDASKGVLLLSEGQGLPIENAYSLADFLGRLESPRNIMLLVPAGPIVDRVMADLVPHLDEDDLIIDGGNSHYTDTERREAQLAVANIGFMGIGVSGGEAGARHGASIMPGGQRKHYDRIERTLQAVSAKVDGEPCVAYMGPGSAGHFVKMVHNGIEYGMMQLIAEAYDILRRAGHSAADIGEIFAEWNRGELNSFLIEITATVLRKTDEDTGRPLVDLILDTAGQKGTGKWTSQAALDLGVPVPTIDSAVTMRQISARKALRQSISGKFAPRDSVGVLPFDVPELGDALHAAFILSYAQGMSLLAAASAEKGYGLDLAEIARIWRGGCIIRSAMLADIRAAYAHDAALDNLLLDQHLASLLAIGRAALRKMAVHCVQNGIPATCFLSSLSYFEAHTSERLPANLIQAQRDYFGAHTYQRIDRGGIFHTDGWDTPTPAV